MKTTKLLSTGAVATALLPLASLAAIDDQGMQYVSAAEGLHGSLRVNILKNEDKGPNDDVTTGGAKDSLRLWITGSGDIGNGWATTYYWEVRDKSDHENASDGVVATQAWDVGLKGPLGSVNFGRLAMVAPRMVPGGSLDTVAGGSAEHFACDVCDNGLRYESAVFNGFQFGVSGTATGDEFKDSGDTRTEDDFFDEYSFAVKYDSPLGFQVGAGYEIDVMHDERFSTVLAAVADAADVADYDDKTGWRFGVRYGQDNWLLGYEYRTYEGFNKFGNLGFTQLSGAAANRNGWYSAAAADRMAGVTTNASDVAAIAATTNVRPLGSRANVGADFNSNLGYAVHRAGVQVKFDRITASAGYSLESQSVDVAGAIDIDRTTFAMDAAYHLGLNSLIAVGWKQQETEQWLRGLPPSTVSNVNSLYSGVRVVGRRAATTTKSTTSQLYYRVDF